MSGTRFTGTEGRSTQHTTVLRPKGATRVGCATEGVAIEGGLVPWAAGGAAVAGGVFGRRGAGRPAAGGTARHAETQGIRRTVLPDHRAATVWLQAAGEPPEATHL